MEWIIGAAISAAAVAVAVIVGFAKIRNDRRHDGLIQWLIEGEPTTTGIVISAKPTGGTVRDVRIRLGFIGGTVTHPPLAKAEWPTDKPRIQFTLDQTAVAAAPGNTFITIIWRTTEQPQHRIEEWFPALLQGVAYESALAQQARGPIRTAWIHLHGAPVEPGPRGLLRRRLTDRIARRELRRLQRH